MEIDRIKQLAVLVILCVGRVADIQGQPDYNLKRLSTGTSANLRALSVTGPNDWWVGGNNGWVSHTTNSGQTWISTQPAGDSVDFRSIYAFNTQEAVAATAGKYPAIWRTQDAGKQWSIVYEPNNPKAFFDGIDFWNDSCGVLFGDPEDNGRMILLFTYDAGRTWYEPEDTTRPLFESGEAAFAASGTSITCVGDSTLALISGGETSRLWYSRDRGRKWSHIRTDIPNPALGGIHLRFPDTLSGEMSYLLHGTPSRGGFSIAITPDSQWVVVGGDYREPQITNGAIAVNRFGMWWNPRTPTRGYRECILTLDTFCWLAVGPTGCDITYNGGLDWQAFTEETDIHVARLLPDRSIIMAGKDGKIILTPIQTRIGNETGAIGRAQKEEQKANVSRQVEQALKGEMKPINRQFKRWVKWYGSGERSERGYVTFQGPYQRLVQKIRQTEGVQKVWVDTCGARNLLYPARGAIFMIIGSDVNGEQNEKCMEIGLFFNEGGIRRPFWMRYLLGRAWGDFNKLTQPIVHIVRDRERWSHQLCAWEKRPPWHPLYQANDESR